MDEKQSVTFALFFYISESPKGHLNLQCTVSNVNVYADKRKSLAESKYPDERIFWCCFLSRGFHDLFVAKRETDPDCKKMYRESLNCQTTLGFSSPWATAQKESG